MRPRLIRDGRGNHGLDERGRQRARGFGVERPVQPDDPAKGGERVGFARPHVRLGNRRPERHAAWVRVLDDDAHGLRELERDTQRRVKVEKVGVRQLLPLMDHPGRQERCLIRYPGRLLMWVLAVPQILRRRMTRRERCPIHGALGEVHRLQRHGNHRVVHAGVLECLLHQVEAKLELAVRRPRPAGRAPAGSRQDRRRRARRGSSWRRRAPGSGHRCRSPRRGRQMRVAGFCAALAKGYRFTTTRSTGVMPWRASGLEVVGPGTPRQDAGVDRRVERLDPAVHHLGKSRDVGDADNRKTCRREGRGGAASRDELHPERGQPPSEIREPRFVRNAQNCTHISRFT